MKQTPIIKVTRAEVESSTSIGGGPEVARIDVDTVDAGFSKFSRFWVSLRINKQGRPVVTVTTKLRDGKQVSKSVTGAFKSGI